MHHKILWCIFIPVIHLASGEWRQTRTKALRIIKKFFLQWTFEPEQRDGWLWEDQNQNKAVNSFWPLRVIGATSRNRVFHKASVQAINVGERATSGRQQPRTGGSAASSPHPRRCHQGEMHTFYTKPFNGFSGRYCEMQLKRKMFKCWAESCNRYVRLWCLDLQKLDPSFRWWENSCRISIPYKGRGWRDPVLQNSKGWKWEYFTN